MLPTMSQADPGRTVLPKRCPRCGERFPADFRVCPRDAVELEEVDTALADPYIGATLGEVYRVDALIAEGGMGRVYEARHTRLAGRVVAVKILHRALATDAEVVSRFRREAEIADAVEHPNVIRIFDVHATADGVPYIVCERLRGEDLGQRLERDGRMSIPDTVHVLRQVCDVLAAVHARGVIHRDLKPNNLFLVGDPARPTVKLIDFGIARLRVPGDAQATATGVVMGTPAFMAPEQARGARVDVRADIYAVGAIAYACVTGRAPYDLLDSAAALHAVLTADPPRPRALIPEIPEDLELVLQRSMARDPDDRYPTLAAFGEALAAFAPAPGASTSASASTTSAALAAPGDRELATIARRARPAIAALSSVAGVYLAGGFAEAFSAGGAGGLAVVAALAALATPTWLYVRHLRLRVWPSSPAAVAGARVGRLVVGAGTAVFTASYLLGRLLDLGFGDGEGPGGWGRVLPWTFGLAAGIGVWLLQGRRRGWTRGG